MGVVDWLAIYGAVVATIVAAWTIFWNIRQSYRDAGRLKITPIPKYEETDGKRDLEFIALEIANVGKRLITIAYVGFKSRRERTRTPCARFSRRTLKESECTDPPYYLSVKELCPLGDLEYFYAEDAAGKVYRSKVVL